MNEKQQILEIIEKYPKHYTKLIKKNAALVRWIDANSRATADFFLAKLRSALYNETDACENGKVKKITRLSAGFTGCGPAKTCKCVAEAIGTGVAKTKQAIPSAQKAAANKKRAATMLNKYGVEHNLQRESVRATLAKPKMSIESHSALIDKDWLHTEYVVNKRSLVDIGKDLGVYYGTVGDYCRAAGFEIRQTSLYSTVETEIVDYIASLGIHTEQHNRTILNKKELDIYIPEYDIAIEVNGLYWHSYHPTLAIPESEFKLKHLAKTDGAAVTGVRVLHFTDYHWINKQPIVKGILNSCLQRNAKLSARQCKFKTVDSKAARAFFDSAHLDGFASASAYYGLYYNDALVQCLSIQRNRFTSYEEYEVVRFATEPGTTVVGGLSKLLANIPAAYTDNLITFCSKDISTANAYKTVGFVSSHDTGPGYFWTDGTRIITRQRAQKKNLSTWLPTYNPALSESENMFAAGYRRYWNTGNYCLKYRK